MSENIPIEKSCGSPQLLPGNEPNNEWLPEQLGTYAQTQYQQIVDGETHLTRPYWRLGHALEIAKKSFGHGQWEQYLKSLGIDPTRASKARAIYRTFANEDDVATPDRRRGLCAASQAAVGRAAGQLRSGQFEEERAGLAEVDQQDRRSHRHRGPRRRLRYGGRGHHLDPGRPQGDL